MSFNEYIYIDICLYIAKKGTIRQMKLTFREWRSKLVGVGMGD